MSEIRQVFFKFYDDYEENYIRYLSGDQTKKLLTALVAFHRDGEITEFEDDPMVAMVYNAICGNIVRDEKKYQSAIKRKQEQRNKDKGKEDDNIGLFSRS